MLNNSDQNDNLTHIAVVVGTRPEAIKMLPVAIALREHSSFRVSVCSTGQHKEMLKQAFEAFDCGAPEYELAVMTPGQSLAELTARILVQLTALFSDSRPDCVLVHGDTTTAFSAAIAAFYQGIPIGHVEAGLRSFDLRRPYPEEFNRVAIDTLSMYMFSPTEEAASNIRSEYKNGGRVFVTGNTGIDALHHVRKRLENDGKLCMSISSRYSFLRPDKMLVLVTGHRRESFGEGFENICAGVASVAANADVQVVYPVHLNPNVSGVVRSHLSSFENVFLIDPVPYLDMVWLLTQASLVITDSGGIQEEAPALGKPVLVMRDVTERPEGLQSELVQLVGTNPKSILLGANKYLGQIRDGKSFIPFDGYGDGRASQRIRDTLAALLR